MHLSSSDVTFDHDLDINFSLLSVIFRSLYSEECRIKSTLVSYALLFYQIFIWLKK